MTPEECKALVRTIPDFPVPGIAFRDITTLISHGAGFAATTQWLAARVAEHGATRVAGMEARGFIFGAAVAARLGLGFVPLRKPGKLPCETIGIDYALEYGTDRLEMDAAAIAPGERVAIVDDLLATGGTAAAAAQLIRSAGGEVAGALFVIDLPDLGGGTRLAEAGVSVNAMMAFPGH